jgi:hypothetical protein
MLSERHSNKKYLLPIILLYAMVIVLSASTAIQSNNLASTHTQLVTSQASLASTQTQLTTTEAILASIQTQLTATKDNLAKTQADLATTHNQLVTSQASLASTQTQLTATKDNLAQTQADLATTMTQLTAIKANLAQTQADLAITQTQLASSLQPPYTAISARQVTWVWRDTKGNLNKWTMPIDSYRAWIQMPDPNPTVTIAVNNQNIPYQDYRPFVVSKSFSNVVPILASQYPDGISFAKEMFNLVTQLDVYSTEDLPHWPVETLTEAGGDCKNLSILFASLIKASSFPYKVQFIYVDIDNPNKPITVNHVFVGVTLGTTTAYVDCTNKDSWGYWNSKPFRGWFFDLQ